MKDFDAEWEERESDDARAFTVRGETFYRKRGLRLETVLETDDEAKADEPLPHVLDRQILRFIEDRDSAHDRYRQLREREEDGLGFRQIQELKRWLIEEETGLPTTAPSGSPSGRERNGASSTARSSSTAARA